MATRKAAAILLLSLAAFLVLSLVGHRPLKAQEASGNAEIMARLDQLLAGQQAILEEVKSIKQELAAIRIQTNKL